MHSFGNDIEFTQICRKASKQAESKPAVSGHYP